MSAPELSEADIRTLLDRLDGESADSLESEILEFKSWEGGPRSDKMLRETAVCFANHRGGTIVLGIADKPTTRKEAILGTPAQLTPDYLKKAVYDGTDPPIRVEVRELTIPEGRLLVVTVPSGRPPHTTAEGLAKIRVGKECRPMRGTDLARLSLSGAGAQSGSTPADGIARPWLILESSDNGSPTSPRDQRFILENRGGVDATSVRMDPIVVRGRTLTALPVMLLRRGGESAEVLADVEFTDRPNRVYEYGQPLGQALALALYGTGRHMDADVDETGHIMLTLRVSYRQLGGQQYSQEFLVRFFWALRKFDPIENL